MAASESSATLGVPENGERVSTFPLVVYVVLWVALNAFAVVLWPKVFEDANVNIVQFLPLLIAYHLSRGSTSAWKWGVVLHVSVSVGATVLAVGHALLNEADPVVITFALGSWLITAFFLFRFRLPFHATRGWVVLVGVAALTLGWSGLRTAQEAQGEFPQAALSAPAPWRVSTDPPRMADLSFFTDDPTLIAFGERDGVPWAIYTYPSKREPTKCIAFTENSQLVGGSCPLDFVEPDHLLSKFFSEGKSGNITYGVVSKRVEGLELRFKNGLVAPVRIVEPPPEAGVGVNVYFAFLPDGEGASSFGISAFGADGERIDRLGSWDTL